MSAKHPDLVHVVIGAEKGVTTAGGQEHNGGWACGRYSGDADTQSGGNRTYTPKPKAERPSFTDWWQEEILEERMSDIARCESKEDAQARHKEWAWAKKLSPAQAGELFEWLYSRFAELDLPVEFMSMPKPRRSKCGTSGEQQAHEEGLQADVGTVYRGMRNGKYLGQQK
jgi:hypothetical protein